MKSFLNHYLLNLMFGSCLWLLSFVALFLWRSPAVMAAEKTSFAYGLLKFSIPITSLEDYTKTGKVDRYLDTYVDCTNPQQSVNFKLNLVHFFSKNNLNISEK